MGPAEWIPPVAMPVQLSRLPSFENGSYLLGGVRVTREHRVAGWPLAERIGNKSPTSQLRALPVPP
jgi:hypothetical protein